MLAAFFAEFQRPQRPQARRTKFRTLYDIPDVLTEDYIQLSIGVTEVILPRDPRSCVITLLPISYGAFVRAERLVCTAWRTRGHARGVRPELPEFQSTCGKDKSLCECVTAAFAVNSIT